MADNAVMELQYIYINGAWHHFDIGIQTACGIVVEDKWSHARTPVAVAPHCDEPPQSRCTCGFPDSHLDHCDTYDD